nr:hypothetical protein [Flavihumibacter rivuli]
MQSVTLAELRKAVAKYPYSTLLHYLLLKKMKSESDPAFQEQLEASTLHFSRNPWIFFLLNQESAPVPAAAEGEQPSVSSSSEEEVATVETTVEEFAGPAWTEPEQEVKADEVAPEPKPEPLQEQEIREPSLPEAVQEPIEETDRANLLEKESPIPIPSIRHVKDQPADLPIFEPYHTIDYFASLGIKLNNTVPSDKLGRQLKSFTEWIRTMKRLPESQLPENLADSGEARAIEALAAGSIEAKEVLTETMAEVLVKQGNIPAALKVYRKLSLAHPDKSAYFADRIEKLKKR